MSRGPGELAGQRGKARGDPGLGLCYRYKMGKRGSCLVVSRMCVGTLALLGAFVCLAACSSGHGPDTASARTPATPVTRGVPPQPTSPASPVAKSVPADHTKEKHGTLHKPGYKSPEGACEQCHGKGLLGSPDAPSCFSCHGKEWGED